MKPRIHVLTTGGTIASIQTQGAGAHPRLKGNDLLDAIPGLSNWTKVTVDSLACLPGSQIHLEMVAQLSRRINELFDRGEADGVVVTQGTDTIDESAYFLDLTIRSDRPIVITGAMRNPSMLGADGPKNLHDALRVASSPASRGCHAVVVFNDEIHAARYVQKTHTQNTAAFASPATGPIGCIVSDEVHYYYSLPKRSRILPPKSDKRVEILKLGIEPSTILLEACMQADVRGIIIEGLGGGRLPPKYAALIRQVVARGRTVVITSRAGRGRIWDPYGYEGAYQQLKEMGVCFGHDLSSPKLRIKLMLALGNLSSPEEIREYIEKE